MLLRGTLQAAVPDAIRPIGRQASMDNDSGCSVYRMRTLVTGASGFLGARLCTELQQRGAEVNPSPATKFFVGRGNAPAVLFLGGPFWRQAWT